MSRLADPVALLDAWEDALAERAVVGAPSLLVSLGWLSADDELANSTVGATDGLLFELRNALFGTRFDCVSICAECGETVEFAFSAGDVTPGRSADRSPVPLVDGALQCRLPVNSDLTALEVAGSPVDARRFLRRCAVEGLATLDELSDEECDRALAELAEADPGASIEIAIECTCTNVWIEEFDIRSFILSELTEWAVRSLRDVHQLASRYGWPESAILRMSPWRRQIYLDACGDT
ncbi:MAG: hypothetical protein QOH54_2531 [Mycobacterium sp.]|jgi:hypothetical protein|nr:hypothetical protein [Mycobacterium sp.]MDT5291717.1 hypothetical protein [Mycobacterium sp.]